MNSLKTKERLLKLLALAQRGVGGEKKNAQRFLERELKKHGLTIADIDDSQSPTIVSPNEICDLYMGLISAEVQIVGSHPYDLINQYWPFPIKNMKYTKMWLLWKAKAIQRFGAGAMQKPTKPIPEQRTEYQLDIFEVLA